MIRIVAGVALQVVAYPLNGVGHALWGNGLASPVALVLSPVSLPLLGLGTGLDLLGAALQGSGEDALERWRDDGK